MHKLTVSVLIPCYNGGRFINRCLDAILKQTYDINLIKIIVVNDGSTDNSLELLQSYQKQYPNMVKIISQENHGVAYARNVLIANVETDFFMFCDVDDYYLPKAIKQMLAASENGKSDIVVSRTYRITANNKRKIWWLTYQMRRHMTPTQYMNINMIWLWNTLVRTDFIRSTGYAWKEGNNLFEDVVGGHYIYSKAKRLSCCRKFTYCFIERYDSLTSAHRLCRANNPEFIHNILHQLEWFIVNFKKRLKDISKQAYQTVMRNVIYLYAMYISGMFYVVPHRIYFPFRRKLSTKKEENWRLAATGLISILTKNNLQLQKPKCWWKKLSYYLEIKHRYTPFLQLATN